MKKFLYVIIILLFVSGCGKNNIKISYVEDVEHQKTNNYTFKFVGESEHFYFQTGKVYFNGDYKKLLISNFKVKDNVKETSLYKLNLYFDNEKLLVDDIERSKNSFENIVIAEYGNAVKRDENGTIYGESDSFLKTTKEDFKKSMKLVGVYCYNSSCIEEKFNIKYIDEN